MIDTSGGVKRLVEAALVAGGGAALARRKHVQQLLVLAYHNIVPTGLQPAGDRSLHLSQRAFASQLDSLLETHRVISLGDALRNHDQHIDPGDTRPRAVITFDDAYSGAVTAGVEELRVRKLPATIFVAPAFLDGGTFWWDALSDATTGLDSRVRERALSDSRGLSDEVWALATRSDLRIHEMPAHMCGTSTHDLDAASGYEQVSLAAHTWSHPNLTALTDTELVDELARPLAWLQRFGDRALPVVSYPYGLADQRVRNAARDAGYTAGFMIDGGWTTFEPQDRFAIPRLNIPAGVSRHGFVLRAAGLIQG
jgi:peptidoglycan/xylan/chitin deacetylase (PgdA/CDA1 family)